MKETMSDLSASSQPVDYSEDAQSEGGMWIALRKAAARLREWFVIQSTAAKLMVVAVALLISAWPAWPAWPWSSASTSVSPGRARNRNVDEETRSIMEAQSERLYSETKAMLGRLKPLT